MSTPKMEVRITSKIEMYAWLMWLSDAPDYENGNNKVFIRYSVGYVDYSGWYRVARPTRQGNEGIVVFVNDEGTTLRIPLYKAIALRFEISPCYIPGRYTLQLEACFVDVL